MGVAHLAHDLAHGLRHGGQPLRPEEEQVRRTKTISVVPMERQGWPPRRGLMAGGEGTQKGNKKPRSVAGLFERWGD